MIPQKSCFYFTSTFMLDRLRRALLAAVVTYPASWETDRIGLYKNNELSMLNGFH